MIVRRLLPLLLLVTIVGLLPGNSAAKSKDAAYWGDHTAYGATLVRPVAEGARTTLYLDLRTDEAGLRRYLERVAAPGYRGMRLSQAQLSRRYGGSQADISKVIRWARDHGLTARVANSRTHVRVRGTALDMTRLFRLGQVAIFETPDHYRYRAATRQPRVPLPLQRTVAYIYGLDHVVNAHRTPTVTPAKLTPGSASTPTPVPMRPKPSPAPPTPAGLKPTPPADVWGVYGNQTITAKWQAVTAGTFTAVATPGGAKCVAPATATQCTISGLTNNTPNTITVTVAANGQSATSAPSSPITPANPIPSACSTLLPSYEIPAPIDISTQYGFSALGQAATYGPSTVAIIQLNQVPDEGDVLALMNNCNTSPGLASIDVSVVSLPGAQQTVGMEADLDTEWMAALAPANTSIVVINAPQTLAGIQEAFETAIALPGLQAISMSYGWPEAVFYADVATPADPGNPMAAVQSITDTINQAAGIAGVYVSAGDQGSFGYPGLPPAGCNTDMQYANVAWPASTPSVTAVGGTMWPNGQTRSGEYVWWEPAGTGWDIAWPCGGAATGGGASQIFTASNWQAETAGTVGGGDRITPDTSLLAGYPGYAIAFGGQINIAEGTSASAPTLAAASLRINAQMVATYGAAYRLPSLGPYLYSLPSSAFVDLTLGGNDIFGNGQCCTSTAGFDMVSGLGVPANMATWPQLFAQMDAQQTPPLLQNSPAVQLQDS
jgi:subtilase family serine protease